MGDHDPVSRGRRRGDDQVMRTPGSPGAVGRSQETSVRPGDIEVVRLDRYHCEEIRQECLPSLPMGFAGELDAGKELSGCDGGHDDVVIGRNELGNRQPAALDLDQRGGIDDQSFQDRSSSSRPRRRARSSSAHAASGAFRSTTSSNWAPVADGAGPMRATALPRRTTVNDSPECSTSSRSCEKRRAASVAESRLMRIRLSDYRNQ